MLRRLKFWFCFHPETGDQILAWDEHGFMSKLRCSKCGAMRFRISTPNWHWSPWRLP